MTLRSNRLRRESRGESEERGWGQIEEGKSRHERFESDGGQYARVEVRGVVPAQERHFKRSRRA